MTGVTSATGEGKKDGEEIIARRWRLYRAACALRFACVFLPGYIHPDEFFQSTEVAASDMFALGKIMHLALTLCAYVRLHFLTENEFFSTCC